MKKLCGVFVALLLAAAAAAAAPTAVTPARVRTSNEGTVADITSPPPAPKGSPQAKHQEEVDADPLRREISHLHWLREVLHDHRPLGSLLQHRLAGCFRQPGAIPLQQQQPHQQQHHRPQPQTNNKALITTNTVTTCKLYCRQIQCCHPSFVIICCSPFFV